MMNNFLANSYDAFPMFGLGIGLMIVSAILLISLLVIAIIALKGYALWHAAKRNEIGWFVAILIINTCGILELIYLYFVIDIWKKKSKAEPKVEEVKKEEENKL